MYLKRVEISGFKSFAEPVTIDFKDGITCVVGPNGSGKSNITDAMRWALGEQSAHTLRGGKMEEIIFDGTEMRRPKGMSEVTIIIDNSEKILPIDYSEVAIKRRLFRSGESEYYINNNQCRLRDIRELIMDTGIGVDGYSFIGQGRVAQIVSDNPEARREAFEEAAGVIKYKKRKAEAQRKLDSTQLNLDRTNDIILDIESRIGGLKTESEKAKEYADLSSRYKTLEINITLKNIDSVTEKNKMLKLQHTDLDKSIENKRADRLSEEETLAVIRKRDAELEVAATELRAKIAEYSEQSLRVSSDAKLDEEKRKTMVKDRGRLSSETEQLQARIESAEAEREQASKSLDEATTMLESLSKEAEEKLAKSAELAAEVTFVQAEIENRRRMVFDLTREKFVKEAELAGNLELMSNFDEAKSGIESELEINEKEIKEAEETKELTIRKLKDIESDIKNITDKRAKTRTEYEKAINESSELRQTLERLRIESEQKKARKKTIEEMEANYEGYNAGVKSLMKNKMRNIHGVVAELMSVEKGYETAVEAALGTTLQNIICEDDESAKKAISWLKENKAGRLTFLPVASVKARSRNKDGKIEKSDGFDAYAVERIICDKKYKGIFDYLLGGVVVASDLDHAVSMSKNNPEGYRFVTLSGEIVSPAGALTGGMYKNKTANLLERRGEIQDLAVNVERLADETEQAVSVLDELNGISSSCLKSLQENETELRTAEAAGAETSGEVKALKFRLSELNERLDKNRRALKTCEEDRTKNSEMNDKLRLEIEESDTKITELEELAENDEELLSDAKSNAEKAAETVTDIRLSESRAKAERLAAEDKLAGIDGNLEALISDKEEKTKELGDVERLESDALSPEDLGEAVGKLESEKAESEIALKAKIKERETIKGQIEESEYKLSMLTEDIERDAGSKSAMEVEIGRQETRLSNWKEKLFDEFELSYVSALDYRKEAFVMSSAVKENREIKARLRELGEVNPGAIRDYDETKERYDFLTEQRADILSGMEDYQKIVKDMDKISREKFKECFDEVVINFDDSFKNLFGGGQGELRLEDDKDPLESGIVISVMPPGKKKLMNIDSYSGYSGGEVSLIAIALMLAILRTKPTPFCILDEVDAALDDANIQRFANYITSFENTQFTVVTHQRSTMEYADALFGVTMQEQGITSILSLALGEKETEEFADKLDSPQGFTN